MAMVLSNSLKALSVTGRLAQAAPRLCLTDGPAVQVLDGMLGVTWCLRCSGFFCRKLNRPVAKVALEHERIRRSGHEIKWLLKTLTRNAIPIKVVRLAGLVTLEECLGL